MSERDSSIILLMLETIDKIFLFTSDLNSPTEFKEDSESFDASLMNFIVLGESVTKLSEEFLNNNPTVEWRKISAFRNVLAHDYFGIYPKEVWEIIQKFLPVLKTELQKIKY